MGFLIIFHESRFIRHIAYKAVERQRICVRLKFPALSREPIACNPLAADIKTVVNGGGACLKTEIKFKNSRFLILIYLHEISIFIFIGKQADRLL